MSENGRSGATFVRFLYNHNPFYPLSACFVLYGLSLTCAEGDSTDYSWMLFGSMAVYTALLVAAACLIVRLGGVWNDARTIICTVAILLTVLSSSFDQRLIERPETGVAVILAGLAMAVLLSELLLRGTGIRLAGLFRAGWYLPIANLFLYPLLLTWLLKRYSRGDAAVSLALMAFPYVAALLFVPLVMAVRKGARCVEGNGTPWRWPLFPLSVFLLLGLSVVARSYMMTLSFYPAPKMLTPWDWHFAAPLVAVAAAVALELGIALRSRVAETVAFYAPAVAFGASFSTGPSTRVQLAFVNTLTEVAASPLMLSLLCAGAVYAYAALRGVRRAERWIVLCLLAFTVVGRDTDGLATLTSVQAWPLLLLLVQQLVVALRERTSQRVLTVAAVAVGVAWAATGSPCFSAFRYAIPVHAMLLATIVIGACWKDEVAEMLRAVGAWAPCVLSGLAIVSRGSPGGVLPGAYLMAMAAVTVATWRYTGSRDHLKSVAVQTVLAGVWILWDAGAALASTSAPRGALHLAIGGLLFAAAVALSVVKGGGARRLRAAWHALVEYGDRINLRRYGRERRRAAPSPAEADTPSGPSAPPAPDP